MRTILLLFLFTLCSCSNNDSSTETDTLPRNLKYLALGDSYTIGESVCSTCRFPIQLQDSIIKYLEDEDQISTRIIAQTGWTTTQLKNAIATQNPSNDFDLVTLLIGVNNQYQNKPFNLYETEFPELVSTAIIKAKGNKNNVIVVSIPDYAFTPFGQGIPDVSAEIDQYNTWAKNYCETNGIHYVNITDITQEGLSEPELVANDGLHSSSEAYSRFVERILPVVREILGI